MFLFNVYTKAWNVSTITVMECNEFQRVTPYITIHINLMLVRTQ